jgi:hypothetical protein
MQRHPSSMVFTRLGVELLSAHSYSVLAVGFRLLCRLMDFVMTSGGSAVEDLKSGEHEGVRVGVGESSNLRSVSTLLKGLIRQI